MCRNRNAQLCIKYGSVLSFLVFATLYLKTLALNEWEASFPFLWAPTSSQVGVSNNCLLRKSRIEVKDDILTSDEINIEPARKKKRTGALQL